VERLWSPWRLAYVTRTARGEHDSCIFCENNGLDTNLVVFTGKTCFVILNLYPYNNGHLMVVPKRHVPTLAASTPEELADVMRQTRQAEMALCL
jgi:ATP adenylyltransferase